MKTLILTLAFVAILPNTSRANDLSPRAAALAYVTASVPVCDTPKRMGPAIGVGASSVGFIAGGALVMGGLATDQGAGLSSKQKGLIAGGSILLGASIAGLIVSSIYLHRARKAKRSTCQLTYANKNERRTDGKETK